MKKNSLTEGSIFKGILFFMIPIILSTLLQQFYNVTDSFIVGRFAGASELAATGATSSITRCLNSLFAGISLGSTVVVARYLGAKDYDSINKANCSTIVFSFSIGLLTLIIGYILAVPMCRWTEVPADIMDMTLSYYRIYLFGFLFNSIYSVTSGCLRALGDSRATLDFIAISSVINIGLDLLFVAVMKLGVQGAAVATALAMITTAVLSILKLARYNEQIYINKDNFEISLPMIGQIVSLGLPNGIQVMASSFSNILAQRYINLFGTFPIAGVTVAQKVNSIVNAPTHGFSPAATTFTSQNLGAGRNDRVKESIKIQLVMSFVVSIAIAIPIFLFADGIAALFNPEPEVVQVAADYMKLLAISEPLQCLSHIYNGTMRGAGNTVFPMLMTGFSQVVVRIAFLYFGLKLHFDIHMIYYSSVVVNISMAILPISYFYLTGYGKKHDLV